MSIICPTVTAYDTDDADEQLMLITGFASRVHIDVADTSLTHHETIFPKLSSLPSDTKIDVHIMSTQIEQHLKYLRRDQVSLVIWHVEATEEHDHFIELVRSAGMKAGVALMKHTSVASVASLLPRLDHVLVFSGNLGEHGGTADLALLKKVSEIRSLAPETEIGWDGGVGLANARTLSEAGIDVLNAGGAIHAANNPQNAYRHLQRAISIDD